MCVRVRVAIVFSLRVLVVVNVNSTEIDKKHPTKHRHERSRAYRRLSLCNVLRRFLRRTTQAYPALFITVATAYNARPAMLSLKPDSETYFRSRIARCIEQELIIDRERSVASA